MTAWFRALVACHIICDDPWPQYYPLDALDGLKGTP